MMLADDDPMNNDQPFRRPTLSRKVSVLAGKATTRRGKKLQILRNRGVFFFLPVYFSNDIVHGSWWYVVGSLGSCFMAIIPLIDIHAHIFNVTAATELKLFSESVTWILLLISSAFYTVGSIVFVRAFEDPRPEPLLKNWKHFCTDELLGSWMFLWAALPSIPYSLVFIRNQPHVLTYWALLGAAIMLCSLSGYFVYVCYPSHHHIMENVKPHILPFVQSIFGKNSFLCRHVQTDWLASCWFFYWSSVIFCLGTYLLIIGSTNGRQLYVWLSTFIDMLCFLIGSAYLCAGSYPPPPSAALVDHDQDADMIGDNIDNPLYYESFSSALQVNHMQYDTENNQYMNHDTMNSSQYGPGLGSGSGSNTMNRTMTSWNANTTNTTNNSASRTATKMNHNNNSSSSNNMKPTIGVSREEEVFNIIHKYSKIKNDDQDSIMPTATTNSNNNNSSNSNNNNSSNNNHNHNNNNNNNSSSNNNNSYGMNYSTSSSNNSNTQKAQLQPSSSSSSSSNNTNIRNNNTTTTTSNSNNNSSDPLAKFLDVSSSSFTSNTATAAGGTTGGTKPYKTLTQEDRKLSTDSLSSENGHRSKSGSSYVRASKFRHIFANPPKIEQTFHNLRISNISGDSNFIQCNHLYCAVGIEGAGGPFTILNLTNYRRYDGNVPLMSEHTAPVLDFDFNPYLHQIVASASEDATIKLWEIPEGGLTSTINTSLFTLSGHRRKVLGIKFHPTVQNILCSISSDGYTKLWDIEKGKEFNSLKPSADANYFDVAWNHTGSYYLTSTKDKNVLFIDGRKSATVAQCINEVHDGGKCVKLVSLHDDHDKFITTGKSKGSMRQVKIWDPRNTSAEIYKLDVDNASGTLMPFFDIYTNLLFIGGKGDANIRYYELNMSGSELYQLSDFKSNVAMKGLCMVPKRSLDYMNNEIDRFLKLTPTSIEPVSFFVPRKSTTFQEDIYPPIYSDTPPHTMKDWLGGSNRLPQRISLIDIDNPNNNSSNNSTNYNVNTSSINANNTTTTKNKSTKNSTNTSFSSTSTTVTGANSQVSSWMQSKQLHQQQLSQNSQSQQVNTSTNTVQQQQQQQQLYEQIQQANKRIIQLETRCKMNGIRI